MFGSVVWQLHFFNLWATLEKNVFHFNIFAFVLFFCIKFMKSIKKTDQCSRSRSQSDEEAERGSSVLHPSSISFFISSLIQSQITSVIQDWSNSLIPHQRISVPEEETETNSLIRSVQTQTQHWYMSNVKWSENKLITERFLRRIRAATFTAVNLTIIHFSF